MYTHVQCSVLRPQCDHLTHGIPADETLYTKPETDLVLFLRVGLTRFDPM